jgi:hypothetical protein
MVIAGKEKLPQLITVVNIEVSIIVTEKEVSFEHRPSLE